MSFNYTGNLEDPVQYVRFKITDTDEATSYFQDEEISYFVNKYEAPQTDAQLNKAASELLKVWIKKLLAAPSRERAGAYEIYGTTAEALKTLLDDINSEIQAGMSPPSVKAGGINKAEVCRVRHDRTSTRPTWHKDMFFDEESV